VDRRIQKTKQLIMNKIILVICIICTFITTAFIFYSFGIFEASSSFLINEPQTSPEQEQKKPYVFGPLSALETEGNRTSNDLNESIVFKGVMMPDPSVLYSTGRLKKELFENIRNTGANIIRLPVHPDLWMRDVNYLENYIVPAVAWANELNTYVIIDWHYIGNIVTGDSGGTLVASMTPLELSENFWTVITDRFTDNPGVIFELCNEPADITPEQWSGAAEKLINIIRNQGAKQLIIVGGVQYAQDLSWIAETPISDGNIAYASHIYPAHGKENWDHYFGTVSESKPVIITEWGYMDENRNSTNQKYLVGDKETYGMPFLNYLGERKIGWVACWYDDTWEPEMLTKDGLGYTKFGQFVMDEIKAN
jgi:hypothetical protein